MLKKIILLSLILSGIKCFSYEPPTVTVNVMGQFKSNEENIIEVHISEKAMDANEASKSAIETQNKIELALKELGIPEDNYSLSNHYSFSEDDKYFAKKTIQIIIPDDFDVQLLCQSVINAGAEGYSDYRSYGLMDSSPQSEKEIPQTMEEAVELAEKKARRLANAFNADIGNIVSIKELSYGPHSSDTISFEITYKLLY